MGVEVQIEPGVFFFNFASRLAQSYSQGEGSYLLVIYQISRLRYVKPANWCPAQILV